MSAELHTALATAIDAAVVAFLAVVTPTLVILARKAGEWFRNQAIRVAVDAGVASAEELARTNQLATSSSKLERAKQVARSLAPKALAQVDDAQLEQLVQGGVARLRPSLSNLVAIGSSIPPSAAAQAILSSASSGMHEPIRIESSARPSAADPLLSGADPLPPPSRTPTAPKLGSARDPIEDAPTPIPPRRKT